MRLGPVNGLKIRVLGDVLVPHRRTTPAGSRLQTVVAAQVPCLTGGRGGRGVAVYSSIRFFSAAFSGLEYHQLILFFLFLLLGGVLE